MIHLTCMVVDDEPLAIKMLENYISRTPYLKLTASFSDPVQALSSLLESPVNVLFLDIQMPDLDGLNLSAMAPRETKIIFTTAFKQYAFESYEVNALDFLLKPIRYNKFLNATEKARQWFELVNGKDQGLSAASAVIPVTGQPVGQNSIYIRTDNHLRQIDLSQIVCVKGLKDYVHIYLENEKRALITHLTMKAMEEMLPSTRFMRVHRSYIVALDKIKSVDRNNCIYLSNEVIHVTDTYKEAFIAYLEAKIPR